MSYAQDLEQILGQLQVRAWNAAWRFTFFVTAVITAVIFADLIWKLLKWRNVKGGGIS